MTAEYETVIHRPLATCPHAYHWDDADDVYRCMYCDDTRTEDQGGRP